MRYLRKTSNYLQRIILFDSTSMMSMIDLITIGIKTPRIDSGYYVEEEFIELTYKNP